MQFPVKFYDKLDVSRFPKEKCSFLE